MVEIEIKYDGGLRCTANHGPSGTTIETDAPLDNQGRGEAFSPTDLCASSLGVCMLTILGIVAENKGIDVGKVKGKLVKEMSSDMPRRISRIAIELEVPLSSDHSQRQILEEAVMACPVHYSLHPNIEKVVTWNWCG